MPFPQALQKTGLRGKLFPSRISSLSITFDAREGFFPLELEIPLEGPSGTKNRAELSFQHPETGVVHTLCCRELLLKSCQGRKLCGSPPCSMKHPLP